VAPISLWLIWRKRDLLAMLPLRPSLLGLAAGLAWGGVWLAGQLGSIDAVAQSALVGMVISAVWAMAGTTVARALVFPLAFLFFCVPFGEFLFPTMMDRTADFVIWALRISGVPVYVEGRSLVIPSGQWQIVEGCSGVRYLIASVVVGSLYAYLTYRSLVRRLIFIGLSVAAPILANWLRAYGIVLLGHVSGNRLATGVDHVIYGWVFFGVIMMGLFWIGAKWQEPEPAVGEGTRTAGGLPGVPALSRSVPLVLVVVAILSVAPLVLDVLEGRGQHGAVTLLNPRAAGGWAPAEAGSFPEWKPLYGGMAAESTTTWGKDGTVVGLFLGYYRNQQPGRELITSENKVIRSKDPDWTLAGYGVARATLPQGASTVSSSEIRGDRGRLLVWRWYSIGGHVTARDYVAKALLVLAKLVGRGDDSAVVMVYTTVREDGRADAARALSDFVGAMGPAIEHSLAEAAAH
jgi:exosortase A